jgi:hypothetical protein
MAARAAAERKRSHKRKEPAAASPATASDAAGAITVETARPRPRGVRRARTIEIEESAAPTWRGKALLFGGGFLFGCWLVSKLVRVPTSAPTHEEGETVWEKIIAAHNKHVAKTNTAIADVRSEMDVIERRVARLERDRDNPPPPRVPPVAS